jgi:hypothetical protein
MRPDSFGGDRGLPEHTTWVGRLYDSFFSYMATPSKHSSSSLRILENSRCGARESIDAIIVFLSEVFIYIPVDG